MKLSRTTKTNIRAIFAGTAVALFLAGYAFAEETHRQADSTDSFAIALEQSKKTGRPVMLVFSGSDWCRWCVKMSKNVFATQEFAAWESKNAIMMEVDFPQRSMLPANIHTRNQMLKSAYGQHVQSYPTVLFLNSEGSVIGKTGYDGKDAASFISTAKTLIPSPHRDLASTDR